MSTLQAQEEVMCLRTCHGTITPKKAKENNLQKFLNMQRENRKFNCIRPQMNIPTLGRSGESSLSCSAFPENFLPLPFTVCKVASSLFLAKSSNCLSPGSLCLQTPEGPRENPAYSCHLGKLPNATPHHTKNLNSRGTNKHNSEE